MTHTFSGRLAFRWLRGVGFFTAFALSAHMARAQAPALGQGWMAEFNLAARQLVALAEAIPAGQFNWRPGPGIRSTGEVFLHIAYGNYWLLAQAGGKIPDGTPPIPPDLEKKVTTKAEVIRWLKNSLDAVAQAYPGTDRTKTVRFLGRDTTSEAVFLRILVHNHEHMGQSVAYARMMGVVPPWSKSSAK
jgi:uncharacterized damage-inducible protein DinB